MSVKHSVLFGMLFTCAGVVGPGKQSELTMHCLHNIRLGGAIVCRWWWQPLPGWCTAQHLVSRQEGQGQQLSSLLSSPTYPPGGILNHLQSMPSYCPQCQAFGMQNHPRYQVIPQLLFAQLNRVIQAQSGESQLYFARLKCHSSCKPLPA